MNVVIEHIKEVAAKACLVVTGGTFSAATLADLDVGLRILLSLIGIPAAIFSLLYYRRKYKKLLESEDD